MKYFIAKCVVMSWEDDDYKKIDYKAFDADVYGIVDDSCGIVNYEKTLKKVDGMLIVKHISFVDKRLYEKNKWIFKELIETYERHPYGIDMSNRMSLMIFPTGNWGVGRQPKIVYD